MSLTVYLELDKPVTKKGSGIFIREKGATREITREEWDKKFPDAVPFTVVEDEESNEVYSANITHNLNKMAEAAGIYQSLWRPEEIGATHARQLIRRLEVGLKKLINSPDDFKKFNPANGWGDYEALVAFVSNYLEACRENPNAKVSVSR